MTSSRIRNSGTSARTAAADLLSAVGILILFLDLFTSSSYKVTAFGLGLCVVGGFLRVTSL